MNIRAILSLVSLTILIACNNDREQPASAAKTNTIEPSDSSIVFDKLLGTWKNSNGISYERWSKNADSTYRSVAFIIKGNDTTWTEQANIYPQSDKWVFENTVKGQNEGKAVQFISSSLNSYSVQFSNPGHDFPTDVNYTVTGPNSVHAFIIGPNAKGGKDTIPFEYVRAR